MYSFCAMNSFRMSFWIVPDSSAQRHALPLGDDEVHREDHRRRRVDRHRRRDLAQRDALEERFHVGQRHDRDAALAHFAERQLVIGIAAHQRRQVKRHAEARAAGGQQMAIARVGLFRRSEAGKLPHRPQLAAVPVAWMPRVYGKVPGSAAVPRPGSRQQRGRPPCTHARTGRPEIVRNTSARSEALAGLSLAPGLIRVQYMSDAHTS